jgi:PKD repeat protein
MKMKNKTMKWIGAAALSLVMIGIAAPSAFTEPAAPPTLTANVVSQQCQGGDGVNVTLTGVLSPNRSGVLYAWDFNGDGVLDTTPDANPTVTNVYPDETVQTATVAVIKNGRTKISDSITFQTIRCP